MHIQAVGDTTHTHARPHAWHGKAKHSTVQQGKAKQGGAGPGGAGRGGAGQEGTGQVRSGQVRSGQVRSGRDRTGRDRTGQAVTHARTHTQTRPRTRTCMEVTVCGLMVRVSLLCAGLWPGSRYCVRAYGEGLMDSQKPTSALVVVLPQTSKLSSQTRECVRVCACVRACVQACVFAWVRVRAHMQCAHTCMCMCTHATCMCTHKCGHTSRTKVRTVDTISVVDCLASCAICYGLNRYGLPRILCNLLWPK